VPMYDFKCNNCGEVSEILFQSSGDKPINCPDCGSTQMERLISSSYIVKAGTSHRGDTCCGREERCEKPPCDSESKCHRH
jgi:putative FmdB family regulatory protein